MAEFTAVANLEARVTQDSLRNARRQIERELGDVEVGVSGSARPTGRQPRDPTSGQFMAQRGPEQRLVDLLELAGERNDLLQELLEASDGGGGGALRTAGAAGLAARFGLGASVANPFTALALLTLGGGAFAAANRTPEAGRPGPGRGRPPERRSAGRFFDELAGDPFGTRRRNPPDRPPRAGGTVEQTNNIEATANVQASDSLRRSEIERFVQARVREAANDIRRELEREAGGGTGSRTGGGGGGRLRN